MSGDLPDGWTWARLEDLVAAEPRAITDGPFGSNLKTAHYTDSGPRVIRLPSDEHASLLLERIAASRSTKPNRRASARQVS